MCLQESNGRKDGPPMFNSMIRIASSLFDLELLGGRTRSAGSLSPNELDELGVDMDSTEGEQLCRPRREKANARASFPNWDSETPRRDFGWRLGDVLAA